MVTALPESPDVEREIFDDDFVGPLSVSPPAEGSRPEPDITFLSVLRFVVGAITGTINLAVQFLVEATLLIPFAPFFLLPLMAFLLIFLVAIAIMAAGAVLAAFGLV